MTRPGLVRAGESPYPATTSCLSADMLSVSPDTIDLQNQDAPTTQDHQTNSLQPSDVGKHQASEIRHVIDERHSEEEHLHDAWNRSTEEPEVNELTDDQLQAHNHENGDSADDSEIDDDMLDDRISSSPSIDDGAYPAVCAWPQRSSSLTPSRQTLNCEATSTPDSSPFVDYPAHLPLSISSTADLADSPASSLQSSSPFLLSPQHLPLSVSPLLRHHHHTGEYQGGYQDDYDQGLDDYSDDNSWDDPLDPIDQDARASTVQGYRLSYGKSVEDLTTILEESTADESDTNQRVLAGDDSLLDHIPGSRATSPSSWSTVSDASTTSNPEDRILHTTRNNNNNDDDDLDVSYYSDDRFVDSGWGGECLRETEDIDFDFVYALHTFVATVEGQANAGKGDTMVLLDDSNSYWWLVRIVKDNSIGPCAAV